MPANATQEVLAPINIGWQVLGPATAFCCLAFLIVLARWYTRIFIVRVAGPEDFLISLAMVRSVKCLYNLDLVLIEKAAHDSSYDYHRISYVN
jgi:hypothetical protein